MQPTIREVETVALNSCASNTPMFTKAARRIVGPVVLEQSGEKEPISD